MGKEDLKNAALNQLEGLKRQIDFELLRRDAVSPEMFLQVHSVNGGCLFSEKSVGFNNADVEGGGGVIIGATEIMQLICNTHKVASSSYAKGHVVRQKQQIYSWRWVVDRNERR